MNPAEIIASPILRRPPVQLDLELQPVKLPDGVTEELKISRRRVYRDSFYTLAISEDDLLKFLSLSFDGKRQTVATKMRIKPGEDDGFDPDELPEQIERFVEILTTASIRLAAERDARERERAMQALRGERR
jgi:hypothetical protein